MLSAVPAFAGTGRNEPCPCGSGKKYKQCHLARDPWREDLLTVVELKVALFSDLDEDTVTRRVGLASSACDPDDPELVAELVAFRDDPIIWDLATVEGGQMEVYLLARGNCSHPKRSSS